MTYLWQEQRGEMIFRIQTDESAVAERMRRRKRFELTGSGMNCRLWIYKASFYSAQKARGALRQLTGRKVKKDIEEGVLYA
jgi:hypothetical protein